jgi:hypothetical protein
LRGFIPVLLIEIFVDLPALFDGQGFERKYWCVVVVFITPRNCFGNARHSFKKTLKRSIGSYTCKESFKENIPSELEVASFCSSPLSFASAPAGIVNFWVGILAKFPKLIWANQKIPKQLIFPPWRPINYPVYENNCTFPCKSDITVSINCTGYGHATKTHKKKESRTTDADLQMH